MNETPPTARPPTCRAAASSRAAPWPASPSSSPPAGGPARRPRRRPPPRRAAVRRSERGRVGRARRRPPRRRPKPSIGRAQLGELDLLHGRRRQGPKQVRTTLDEFKAKYGTTVKYKEVIDDNDAFVGTIKPQLEAGKDTGWDLIVLTDWMAARLIRLGWVEQMDLGNMPNVVANLQDVYRNVTWDPTNDHHVPWQSGMTGLGYDKAKTGDLTSLDALVRPQVQGQGRLPDRDARHDRADDAQARPRPGEGDQGRLRCGDRRDQEGRRRRHRPGVQGQRVRRGPQSRATSSCRWPGRATWCRRSGGQDEPRFTSPTEGGMLWTDNCLIPKGAKNAYTAAGHDRLLLRPDDRGADRGVRQLHLPGQGGGRGARSPTDPAIANNPLIFPPADILAKLHIFNGLDEATEKYFNDQFATVSQA